MRVAVDCFQTNGTANSRCSCWQVSPPSLRYQCLGPCQTYLCHLTHERSADPRDGAGGDELRPRERLEAAADDVHRERLRCGALTTPAHTRRRTTQLLCAGRNSNRSFGRGDALFEPPNWHLPSNIGAEQGCPPHPLFQHDRCFTVRGASEMGCTAAPTFPARKDGSACVSKRVPPARRCQRRRRGTSVAGTVPNEPLILISVFNQYESRQTPAPPTGQ